MNTGIFIKKNIKVTFHSLDLSEEMLKIQKNNPKIQKLINLPIEECRESNYDLILMIGCTEHIPENSAAK